MIKMIRARSVLAVCKLKESTEYYVDVLGFERDPVDAEGWSFLSRDGFSLTLGECPDERPAEETGNHSYFAYVEVQGVDQIHQQVTSRGAEVISELTDKEWGIGEFGVRTIDGHRVMFGEEINK
jgi:uncharacterized glyoxalase superfamily protein PhnB